MVSLKEFLPSYLKRLSSENTFLWATAQLEVPQSMFSTEENVILTYDVQDRSFSPYLTAGNVIEQIIAFYQDDFPQQARVVQDAYQKLEREWKNTNLSADSILYSIIRRISRETIATAKLIDGLVVALLDLLKCAYAAHQKCFVLFLSHTEWIDRPSLRIFYRLYKLVPQFRFAMVWLFSSAVPNRIEAAEDHEDMLASVELARTRIFSRLQTELNPVVEAGSQTAHTYEDYHFFSEHSLMEEAALAVVTQNYEHAYLACKNALLGQTDKTEVYRIIALVHANLGLVEPAYSMFQRSAELVGPGPKRAHFEYMSALLVTKRFYQLEKARQHYEKGLAFVDESDETNRLEKGWLLNGMSFMDVVTSSNLQGEEKDILLEEVLRREVQALNLIKQDSNRGALYLRFNLYSNIAFLMEIKKEYKYALQCWRNAFERATGIDNEMSRNVLKPFAYRTGMLAWKSGEVQEGLRFLRQARDAAKEQGDRIYLEQIAYGLGYVEMQEEMFADALATFLEGYRLAVSMGEWKNANDFAVGCLQAASRVGKFSEVVSTLRADLQEDYLFSEQIKSFIYQNIGILQQLVMEKTLPQPKTKLNSYHPSIDLESTPEVDMNAFLIAEKSDRGIQDLQRPVPQVRGAI